MSGVTTLELSIRREDVLHFLDYPDGRQPPARVSGPLDAAIEEALTVVRDEKRSALLEIVIPPL